MSAEAFRSKWGNWTPPSDSEKALGMAPTEPAKPIRATRKQGFEGFAGDVPTPFLKNEGPADRLERAGYVIVRSAVLGEDVALVLGPGSPSPAGLVRFELAELEAILALPRMRARQAVRDLHAVKVAAPGARLTSVQPDDGRPPGAVPEPQEQAVGTPQEQAPPRQRPTVGTPADQARGAAEPGAWTASSHGDPEPAQPSLFGSEGGRP
jgi:hypothetical protein